MFRDVQDIRSSSDLAFAGVFSVRCKEKSDPRIAHILKGKINYFDQVRLVILPAVLQRSVRVESARSSDYDSVRLLNSSSYFVSGPFS